MSLSDRERAGAFEVSFARFVAVHHEADLRSLTPTDFPLCLPTIIDTQK